MKGQLRLRAIGGLGRPVPIGLDPVTIGRNPDNVIRILDEKTSRKHCVIRLDRSGSSATLKDLGSRNGTFVNGAQVVDPQQIGDGDVITIGDADLIVEAVRVAEDLPGDEESGAEVGAGGPDGAAPTSVDERPRRRRNKKEEAEEAERLAAQVRSEWSKQLRKILEELPPSVDREPVPSIIDARGKASSALSGSGDGSAAFTLILQVASKARATDIHVEPKADQTHVRMRVDGQMIWISELPRAVGDLLGGIVKTACAMKTTHNEAVLDGHFSARWPDRRVEFRASFTPSVHGQKLVIRILDMRGAPSSLAELGLAPYMIDPIRRVVRQDSGMFLVCGPTGSGKTTTLYNGLREIDRDAKNVVTIEDPVEYQIDGVTQMPVDERRGNNFSELLRSVLRQDPDVILVGEIRDQETARTAMQASMTGHVVFSTVHAKETIGAVFRLLDLGIEPYLVANSLDLVLAQRLVRVLCPSCKRAVPIPPGVASRIGTHLHGKTESYVPVGCSRCLGAGYRGRRGIYELLVFDDELRDVVLNTPSIQAMKKVIAGGLFTTLVEFGWRLAADGHTSLDEVDRVAGQS